MEDRYSWDTEVRNHSKDEWDRRMEDYERMLDLEGEASRRIPRPCRTPEEEAAYQERILVVRERRRRQKVAAAWRGLRKMKAAIALREGRPQ